VKEIAIEPAAGEKQTKERGKYKNKNFKKGIQVEVPVPVAARSKA
jgi:hypothetical protein